MTAPRYIVLEKKRGETPLQAIEEWKRSHPEFADVPASYAGRLDPMASGKLLVLLGEECKRKDRYIGLDKEYEVMIALDLSTDTSDALGLAKYAGKQTDASESDIRKALAKLTGSHRAPYPGYSSKTVNGTPLFMYALRGKLDTIVIPEHIETIYKTTLIDLKQVSKDELSARIGLDLNIVPTSDEPSKELGQDFRQHEIRARWKEVFDSLPERQFSILTLRITCASGTYMRSLSSRLAQELGTTAFALSIHRSKIGRYVSIGPFGFWSKLF